MGLRRQLSPGLLGWMLFPSLASLVAFVPGLLRPKYPLQSRLTMSVVDPTAPLLQGWKAKSKRGPPKYHLPTGGPNVTKTADLMELRVSYTVDTRTAVGGLRQLVRK